MISKENIFHLMSDELEVGLVLEAIKIYMGIDRNEPIEMKYSEKDDTITITRLTPYCTLCGSADVEQIQHDKYLCTACVDKITMYEEKEEEASKMKRRAEKAENLYLLEKS